MKVIMASFRSQKKFYILLFAITAFYNTLVAMVGPTTIDTKSQHEQTQEAIGNILNTPGKFADICASGDTELVKRILKAMPLGYVITKECFIRAARNGYQDIFDLLLSCIHRDNRHIYFKDLDIFKAVCAGNLTQILEWPLTHEKNGSTSYHWIHVLYNGIYNNNNTNVSRALFELKKAGSILFPERFSYDKNLIATACYYDMRDFISAYLLYQTLDHDTSALKDILVYSARYHNNNLFSSIFSMFDRFCTIRRTALANDIDIFEAARRIDLPKDLADVEVSFPKCPTTCPHTTIYPTLFYDVDIFQAACIGNNKAICTWFLKNDLILFYECKTQKKAYKRLIFKKDHTGRNLWLTYETFIDICLDDIKHDPEIEKAKSKALSEFRPRPRISFPITRRRR